MQHVSFTDEYNLVDRRVFQRFRVSYLAEVYMGHEILFASVVDVSEKGVGIMLPGQFYAGEKLSLHIKSSLYDDNNIEEQEINICMTAEVVWVEKQGKLYKAGLKITQIDTADLLKLKRNIRSLHKRTGW